MTRPVWVTPAGSLGTIPEGVFYSTPLVADADNDTVYYQVIAGKLPLGIRVNETGILSGNPQATATIQGVPSDVTRDTTSQFVVRAYTVQIVGGISMTNRLADRTFSITVAAATAVNWITPAGHIATYNDGTQVYGLPVLYSNPDVYSAAVVRIIDGALPPGLTIDNNGIISGYIIPDFATHVTQHTYTFTLKVSNGVSNNVRTFSILIFARETMAADNEYPLPPPNRLYLSADQTFPTGDETPIQVPVITTPPGSIGSTRRDNFYAFQFSGFDPYNNAFEFVAVTDLPPGLTLDPVTGWLYGYIPDEGVAAADYAFELRVQEVADPTNFSALYEFSLTITGTINSDVVWLTPADAVERARTPSSLGLIDNGATSTFSVQAVNTSGIPLQYQLLSGSNSRLPQGLQLLPSGDIAGRVSFNTFALDKGVTVFDVNIDTATEPTTFDMTAVFTVRVFNVGGLIDTTKIFSITVVRRYNEPYDNLYIQAMPPINDRVIINDLLQNSDIFQQDLLYRPTDPNFGVAKNVKYYHAYGLTAATLDEYVASLDVNHYWKNLVLGQIDVAQAIDSTGTVLYEVVYSKVIDDSVNSQGQSVSKQVTLPYTLASGDAEGTATVYPNSLINMRNQVIDTVGQISNVLPLWMVSKQANGQTLGFTPAWVIAYAKPGCSKQLAYYIGQDFVKKLNTIDFEADRYELDNLLTHNWNREQQQWGYTGDTVDPYPASLTTFDLSYIPPPGTTFDGGSMQFTAPVDMYSSTDLYNKYLLFPRRNILSPLPPSQAGVITWTNNQLQPLIWVNELGQVIEWTSSVDGLITWTNNQLQPLIWVNELGQVIEWTSQGS
jgi:hypothetical protein